LPFSELVYPELVSGEGCSVGKSKSHSQVVLKKHRTKYSLAQNLHRLLKFMNQVAQEMFYGNLILEDAMRGLVVSIMLNSKK
jgi:hypothetical protein